ncbi:MAG: hypothetical protein ACRDOL_05050 [Streptosporangiaceae bacterium]
MSSRVRRSGVPCQPRRAALISRSMARSACPSAATLRASSARYLIRSASCVRSLLMFSSSCASRARSARSRAVLSTFPASLSTPAGRPSSQASCAARSSLLLRAAGSALSSTARSSAVIATLIAARRSALDAASSSSAAAFSSGPVLAPARCQACRSGSPSSTAASARWADVIGSRPARCSMAERTSGCRNHTPAGPASTSRAAIAGVTAAVLTASPHSRPAAASVSPSAPPSFRAATSRTVLVCSGSSVHRAAKAFSMRSVTGTAPRLAGALAARSAWSACRDSS